MGQRTSSWSVWNNVSSTDRYIRSADGWIEARQKDDGTDGLWRVHDGLYDLRPWIRNHPGGPQWLEITKVGILIIVLTFFTFFFFCKPSVFFSRKIIVRTKKNIRTYTKVPVEI